MDDHTPSIGDKPIWYTLEQIASIPEAPLYQSILTDAPKLNLRLPLALSKITKAFFFVSFLTIFVDRSIAHGLWDYGYPPPVGGLGGSSSNNINNNHLETRNERETLGGSQPVSTTNATMKTTKFPRRSILTDQAKEDMLNGIAQDIFFHPIELNFYESKWEVFFDGWAVDAQSRYQEARQTRPNLSKFTFFAEDVLDWQGLECSPTKKGCQKFPTPEMVRKHFPNDRFKARQVIYTLDAFRKMHMEVHIYTLALKAATDDVSGYCGVFAKTFFHGATKGYKKMCTAQIVQIVLGVMMAIIAVVSLGQALYALAPLVATGISSLVASGSLAATEIGADLAIEGAVEAGVEAAVEAASEISAESILGSGVAEPLIEATVSTAGDIGGAAAGGEAGMATLDGFTYVAPYVESVTDFSGVGSAASESIVGSSVGAVGEGAVSDTASSVFSGISEMSAGWAEGDAGFSNAADFFEWGEWAYEGQLPKILEKQVVTKVGKLFTSGLRPMHLPYQIGKSFSARAFTRMVQQTALELRGLVEPYVMKGLFNKYAGNVFEKAILDKVAHAGVSLAGASVKREEHDDKFIQEMKDATKDTLLEALIASAAEEIGVPDIPAFVENEKKRILGRRNALKRNMDNAMSSFSRSKRDRELPKVWGSFAVVEWFPIDSLTEPFLPPSSLEFEEDSVYDAGSVHSRFVFKKYPKALQLKDTNGMPLYSEQSAESAIWNKPSWMRTEGNATKSDFDTNVLRLSKLFTMYELPFAKTTVPNVDSPWALGSRIVWRMQDQNGVSMTANDALKFWEDNGDEIHRRVQLLRQIDYESNHVPLKKPLAHVESEEGTLHHGISIGVNTAHDTLPWSAILGTVNFKGYDKAGTASNQHPELKWQAKSIVNGHHNTKKRDIQPYSDRLARHDVRGKLNLLQSLGLVGTPRSWKRDGGGITLQQQDGNMFVAEINDHLFKNDIHHEACGKDHYTGNTHENTKSCGKFLQTIQEQISDKMFKTIRHDYGDLQTLSITMAERFSNYAGFLEPDKLELDKNGLLENLRKNLQNNLVSKAYADENCFLYCFTHGFKPFYTHEVCPPELDHCITVYPPPYTPSRNAEWPDKVVMQYGNLIDCEAGCYDPIEGGFERLYGFDSYGGAKAQPWGLDEEKINVASWYAWRNGSMEGYVPGRIDLNPYTHSVKDDTPILPVCATQFGEAPYGSGLLCNCGDKYGDETDNIVAVGQWKTESKRNEYEAIDVCMNRLNYLAWDFPAAYLVNMCRVFYVQYVPPGSGSAQEKDDKGDYKANLLACQQYLDFYEQNKGATDDEFNDGICRLWAYFAKNFNADGIHPDFSFVNNMIKEGGCQAYY